MLFLSIKSKKVLLFLNLIINQNFNIFSIFHCDIIFSHIVLQIMYIHENDIINKFS